MGISVESLLTSIMTLHERKKSMIDIAVYLHYELMNKHLDLFEK
jgi:hypothetical protein